MIFFRPTFLGGILEDVVVSETGLGWAAQAEESHPGPGTRTLGPVLEPLPMHGHSFVPAAACFWPQFYAQPRYR